MAKTDWLRDRAAVLVACLHDHGLVIEADVAREIISTRVVEISDAMGISAATARKYISDDAIEEIAIAMADMMVFEAPGVDLMAAARSSPLPRLLVGKMVSALAEAILFFQRHPDIHASGDRIRELSEHLSIFGAMIADSASAASVMVPPEFLTRIAGRLEAAAAEPSASETLAGAWQRDAARVRASILGN